MSIPPPDAEPSETDAEPVAGTADFGDSAEPAAEPAAADVEALPEPVVTIHTAEASIRRAPKIPVFIVLGALIGAFVTVAITLSFPIDPSVGLPATVGYFLLYGIPAGVVLGALVGIVLDRFSARGARSVTVEQTVVDPIPWDDELPADGMPADGMPADGMPADEQSADLPTAAQPAAHRPTDARPADAPPTADPPTAAPRSAARPADPAAAEDGSPAGTASRP